MRYFISSLPADAQTLADAIRSHWGWRMACIGCWTCLSPRTAAVPAPTTRRRTWPCCGAGLVLLPGRTITGGIEKKRLQAAWNDGSREKLLGLFGEI